MFIQEVKWELDSVLILYVDDILLIGNNVSMLNSVKESLNGKFSMKDLGEAVYIFRHEDL